VTSDRLLMLPPHLGRDGEIRDETPEGIPPTSMTNMSKLVLTTQIHSLHEYLVEMQSVADLGVNPATNRP